MFVDSSYWVALADAKDQWHARAMSLQEQVPDGSALLDLALAEAVTIVGSRRGGKQSRALYQFFCDSCRIVFADAELLDSSMDLVVSRDGRLSVADAATIQAMIRERDRVILSFDSDFDSFPGISRLH